MQPLLAVVRHSRHSLLNRIFGFLQSILLQVQLHHSLDPPVGTVILRQQTPTDKQQTTIHMAKGHVARVAATLPVEYAKFPGHSYPQRSIPTVLATVHSPARHRKYRDLRRYPPNADPPQAMIRMRRRRATKAMPAVTKTRPFPFTIHRCLRRVLTSSLARQQLPLPLRINSFKKFQGLRNRLHGQLVLRQASAPLFKNHLQMSEGYPELLELHLILDGGVAVLAVTQMGGRSVHHHVSICYPVNDYSCGSKQM